MSHCYDTHLIIVTVEGGLVQGVEIPEGCNAEVEVRDYDIDNKDEQKLEIDEDGALYYCYCWRN